LVPNPGGPTPERINSSELKKYFGFRKLGNWKLLEDTGKGIHVVKDSEVPEMLGDFATIRRDNLGKLLQRPAAQTLHTVGMDIGYGEGTSPGLVPSPNLCLWHEDENCRICHRSSLEFLY
jgi:hypothetical protein